MFGALAAGADPHAQHVAVAGQVDPESDVDGPVGDLPIADLDVDRGSPPHPQNFGQSRDGAPFAYTIGLTEHGHPEFVIAGLRPTISHALLNDMAARVCDHHAQFHHGQHVTDLLDGYDAILIYGPITRELYPGTACGRYRQDQVRLRQIVWPDPNGCYPWDCGYQFPKDTQPTLGRP